MKTANCVDSASVEASSALMHNRLDCDQLDLLQPQSQPVQKSHLFCSAVASILLNTFINTYKIREENEMQDIKMSSEVLQKKCNTNGAIFNSKFIKVLMLSISVLVRRFLKIITFFCKTGCLKV